MHLKPNLQQTLTQTLKMTPQLQQAIRLLHLSARELEHEINTLLEDNTLLERTEPERPEHDRADSERIEFEKTDTIEPPEWFDTHSIAENKSQDFDWTNHFSHSISLRENLMWQKSLTKFTYREDLIANTLIDSITEEGYLGVSLKDIQESLTIQNHPDILKEIPISEITSVLKVIQQFDPLGVGATSLSECLLLQLNALPSDTPWLFEAKQIAEHFLPMLANKAYARLKSRLKLNNEGLQGAIHILTKLEPKPGLKFSAKTREFIIPDVFVVKQNGVFSVKLNMEQIPKIRVNTQVATILKNAKTGTERNYLKNQLHEARWFMKSLKTRQDTLLKVSSCIVEQQKAFFEYGVEALKPMSLQDVADKVLLHESTISRITNQKYMDTPKGIFELKFFFSNPIQTKGGDISATSIKSLIKKMISSESSQKPYNDSKIALYLKQEGITLSRRTVTKYRESMNIPPAHHRKKIF